MIISEEQVRRAVEYLQTSEKCDEAHGRCPEDAGITQELVDRVRRSLDSMPELRSDRIEHGRALVASGGYASGEVAEKMIGRIISDSIR